MTLRSKKVKRTTIMAAEVVGAGERGWGDVLTVIQNGANPESDRPLAGLVDQMHSLRDAREGLWIVWVGGADLMIRDKAWVDERLPEKSTKGAKRCMFIWYKDGEWHQCDQRRVWHEHPEERSTYPQMFVNPRDGYRRRCLGLGVRGETKEGRKHIADGQCEKVRLWCTVPHAFYAKTRLDPEEKG